MLGHISRLKIALFSRGSGSVSGRVLRRKADSFGTKRPSGALSRPQVGEEGHSATAALPLVVVILP